MTDKYHHIMIQMLTNEINYLRRELEGVEDRIEKFEERGDAGLKCHIAHLQGMRQVYETEIGRLRYLREEDPE